MDICWKNGQKLEWPGDFFFDDWDWWIPSIVTSYPSIYLTLILSIFRWCGLRTYHSKTTFLEIDTPIIQTFSLDFKLSPWTQRRQEYNSKTLCLLQSKVCWQLSHMKRDYSSFALKYILQDQALPVNLQHRARANYGQPVVLSTVQDGICMSPMAFSTFMGIGVFIVGSVVMLASYLRRPKA